MPERLGLPFEAKAIPNTSDTTLHFAHAVHPPHSTAAHGGVTATIPTALELKSVLQAVFESTECLQPEKNRRDPIRRDR